MFPVTCVFFFALFHMHLPSELQQNEHVRLDTQSGGAQKEMGAHDVPLGLMKEAGGERYAFNDQRACTQGGTVLIYLVR